MYQSAPPLYELPPTYSEAITGAFRIRSHDSPNKIWSPNNLIENSVERDIEYGKGRPTVVQIAPFNPENDVKLLRTAISSCTQNKEIMKLLCNRSVDQRLEIAKTYFNIYRHHLIFDLRNVVVDKFVLVLNGLLQSNLEYFVSELNYAICSDLKQYQSMLISLSNDEMDVVKEAYLKEFQCSLISDCDKYLVGNQYKTIVQTLLTNKRELDDTELPSSTLNCDIITFMNLDRRTTLDDFINCQVYNILCIRSWKHIRKIDMEFKIRKRYSLKKTIKDNFQSDIQDFYLAILRYALNKSSFFAKGLERSMKGLGTDDRELIRIIVSRSEIDLFDIKDSFKIMTKDTLKNWIRGDTNGLYKYALYELIGEPKQFQWTSSLGQVMQTI